MGVKPGVCDRLCVRVCVPSEVKILLQLCRCSLLVLRLQTWRIRMKVCARSRGSGWGWQSEEGEKCRSTCTQIGSDPSEKAAAIKLKDMVL